MNHLQRGAAAMAFALSLAGCAAAPESIKPANISTTQYAYLNCTQLAAFRVTLTNAYNKVAGEENTARNLDAATILPLGLPLGSMTHENVPYQIWDLKGRLIAVQKLQAQYKCYTANASLTQHS